MSNVEKRDAPGGDQKNGRVRQTCPGFCMEVKGNKNVSPEMLGKKHG